MLRGFALGQLTSVKHKLFLAVVMIFDHVINLVETNKWTQGTFSPSQGCIPTKHKHYHNHHHSNQKCTFTPTLATTATFASQTTLSTLPQPTVPHART